jgi:hypothetical protein
MSTLPREFKPLEYNVDLEHGLVWHVLGFFSIGEDGNPILRGVLASTMARENALSKARKLPSRAILKDVRHVWV